MPKIGTFSPVGSSLSTQGIVLSMDAVIGSRVFIPILYFIVAFPIVVFLSQFRQPIGVADEWSHIARADQLAHGTLLTEVAKPGLPPMGSIDASFLKFMQEVHKKWREPLITALPGFRAYPWSQERVLFNYNSSVYFPLSFLPTAVVVTAGRALGVNIVDTLRAASLTNGLLCLFMTAAALTLARRGRFMIFAVGILPMTLNQFSSSSPDGLLVASALMVCAFLTECIYEKRLSLTALGLCTLLGVVVAATKIPYLPLMLGALAGMWIAADRASRPAGTLLAAALLAVASVSVVWSLITNSGSIDVSWGAKLGDPGRQVQFLLENPITIVTIATATIRALGLSYLGQMVGYLGWQDAPISVVSQIFFVVLLGILALRDGAAAGAGTTIAVSVGFCASIAAIFLAVYVVMVSVGSLTAIIGVQGRYFLPLLPFVCIVSPFSASRLGVRITLLSLVILASFVAGFEVVNTIITRYYL